MVNLPVSDDVEKKFIVIGQRFNNSQYVDVTGVIGYCHRFTVWNATQQSSLYQDALYRIEYLKLF